MKKISVIIPYKDEAKYIKDCVSTIPESAEIEILLAGKRLYLSGFLRTRGFP